MPAMKLIVAFVALSLLSSCSLLKVPVRTLKAVGRTFGITANDASLQINSDHLEISPDEYSD